MRRRKESLAEFRARTGIEPKRTMVGTRQSLTAGQGAYYGLNSNLPAVLPRDQQIKALETIIDEDPERVSTPQYVDQCIVESERIKAKILDRLNKCSGRHCIPGLRLNNGSSIVFTNHKDLLEFKARYHKADGEGEASEVQPKSKPERQPQDPEQPPVQQPTPIAKYAR